MAQLSECEEAAWSCILRRQRPQEEAHRKASLSLWVAVGCQEKLGWLEVLTDRNRAGEARGRRRRRCQSALAEPSTTISIQILRIRFFNCIDKHETMILQ